MPAGPPRPQAIGGGEPPAGGALGPRPSGESGPDTKAPATPVPGGFESPDERLSGEHRASWQGSPWQVWPQAPQFRASVRGSTQEPLHVVKGAEHPPPDPLEAAASPPAPAPVALLLPPVPPVPEV